MKKITALVLTATMSITMLVGCGSKGSEDGQVSGSKDKVVVKFLGKTFGDKSYWDSAKEGVERAKVDFADKADIEIIETTSDEQRHLSAMYEAVDQGADYIITADFIDNLMEVAEANPDVNFITWDEPIKDVDNIYSVGFQTSEAAFLGGIVAADIASSGLEGTSEENRIGFIGGLDETPVIQEFLVGYLQGAKFYDESVKFDDSYVGSWSDSAKAKELAFAQFNNSKADIIFACAGSSGIGAIEAAAEAGKYIVGVDADQSELFAGKDERKVFATSVLKLVGNALYGAIEDAINGNYTSGYEVLGYADGVVGIVKNDLYEQYVSEAGKAKIKEAEEGLEAGSIEVKSIIGKSQKEITEFINQFK